MGFHLERLSSTQTSPEHFNKIKKTLSISACAVFEAILNLVRLPRGQAPKKVLTHSTVLCTTLT